MLSTIDLFLVYEFIKFIFWTLSIIYSCLWFMSLSSLNQESLLFTSIFNN